LDNARIGWMPGWRRSVLNMTELLDQPVLRTPTMLYLFHRVEAAARWKPRHDPHRRGLESPRRRGVLGAASATDETLRKAQCHRGFGTQSARDALESRFRAIIEQSATQILYRQPAAASRRLLRWIRLEPP